MQNIVRRLSQSRDDRVSQEAPSPRGSSTQSENEQALKEMADMQRVQLEALRTEIDGLRAENDELKEELENVKGELEAERMPPQMRRLHGLPPKQHAAAENGPANKMQGGAELEELQTKLHALQSQLSDSQQREQSSSTQLRQAGQENAVLRAALNVQSSDAAVAIADRSEPRVEQQHAALQSRVAELEAQLDDKHEHLAETALLVEKMFSEFSALQVEFLALKSKSSAVPGDSLDVAALHAALDCKDKQLESAASDMAKMSMYYADLGEQLQLSKIEHAQLQILCEDIVHEFDAASQQWDTTVRSILREKFSREQHAAAAKVSEMVDGRAPIFAQKATAARGQ